MIKVNLKVEPSEESWAAVQKILDEKDGVCGYVVDKVNVLGIVQRLIDKGFNVRLPTEKIKPMAVPVGIEPTMKVRGQPVALGIKLGELAITEHMIWLGANVSVADVGEEGHGEGRRRPRRSRRPDSRPYVCCRAVRLSSWTCVSRRRRLISSASFFMSVAPKWSSSMRAASVGRGNAITFEGRVARAEAV